LHGHQNDNTNRRRDARGADGQEEGNRQQNELGLRGEEGRAAEGRVGIREENGISLPTVYKQFGIDYVDTFAMLRELEARFLWEQC
jgi:hypothetical protein